VETDRLKARLRAAIARRRHTAAMRAADRVAGIVQNAVRNRYNWDIEVNGESLTLEQAVRDHEGAVFDVGANVGQWALQALCRCNGRPLHCFEAIPATFRQLESNLMGAENVQLHNLALGGERGTVDLNYWQATPNVSSRYDVATMYARGTPERVEVEVTTGDHYCASQRIDRIAMLKVDVEGMEYEVLAGFRSMLESRRIGVVQFEYGPGYIGARRYLRDVCTLLNDLGYDLFRQFPDGLESFDYIGEDEDFRGRNFVAVVRRGPGRCQPAHPDESRGTLESSPGAGGSIHSMTESACLVNPSR
jgi:FkbM family methyltransferase